MKLFYSDTFELPLPDNHRFPMAKYTLLRERIKDDPLGETCELHLPPAATDEQIQLVHAAAYVQAIKSGQLSALQIRRIGFPWSPKMVERSRRSTGASIAAARAAYNDGIAANLAGGTHHAFADNGQGYCVFNDACVAAKVLQTEGLAKNTLVIDCDVHQGNGTAGIAKGDPSLFSFSVHCEKNYPFQKTDGDFDIALPAGSTDEYYLAQLKHGLDQVFRQFKADFVFYLAGADPFEGDRLGLLSLTKEGLRRRDQLVIDYCRDLEIPMALSMAGGYAPNIDDIVDIHFSTINIASQRFLRDQIAI
ncbi:MAG: histone deacetylase [Mariniblastus sp.]